MNCTKLKLEVHPCYATTTSCTQKFYVLHITYIVQYTGVIKWLHQAITWVSNIGLSNFPPVGSWQDSIRCAENWMCLCCWNCIAISRPKLIMLKRYLALLVGDNWLQNYMNINTMLFYDNVLCFTSISLRFNFILTLAGICSTSIWSFIIGDLKYHDKDNGYYY